MFAHNVPQLVCVCAELLLVVTLPDEVEVLSIVEGGCVSLLLIPVVAIEVVVAKSGKIASVCCSF